MQFSQLEREMHNSPLKCTTNSDAMASPDKQKSSPMQAQAYRNSGSKMQQSPSLVSPTKTTANLARPSYSPSPDKQGALRSENIRMEDPSMRSPPQKKYSSPQRSGAKRVSPSKEQRPFGKSIEIIKSKLSHNPTLNATS